VRISITDSGEGIPPKEKEKIFEPFFTTKERGTGLGLSIVHKIVENHNGVIKVESEIGKGSTFTIFLPAN
jgi:signal transduction histidine kinase